MVKKFFAMSIAVLLIVSAAAFAFDQGEIHGSIGGYVFRTITNRATDDSETYFDHNFRVGYFVTNMLRLDLILTLDNLNGDQDFGMDAGPGARYFYYDSGLFSLGSGADFIVGVGDGRQAFNEDGDEVTPLAVDIIGLEGQIWPMEGGAFTASLSYRINNLSGGDIGTNEFGVNLGMVIRIK